MLIWTILILLGIAHDSKTECMPFPALERMASLGQLTVQQEHCLERPSTHPMMLENQAWVLWLSRWRRTQDVQQRDKQARALLQNGQVPDRALWAAGLLAKEAPTLALEALDRAESMAHQWTRLSYRLEQMQTLFTLRTTLEPKQAPIRWAQTWVGMGVTGAFLDAAQIACRQVADASVCQTPLKTSLLSLPPVGQWRACQNEMHLWLQRLGKRAYSTERDCLIHAAYLMDSGPEKLNMMRWALILSMSRDEHYVTGAAMRLFAPTLLTDRNTILTAASFHRKQGDDAGAAWWETQAK